MNWICEAAEDYCDSVRDGTHDSPKPVAEGHKLITSKHITDGKLNLSSANCISNDDYDEINKRSKVDINDVLFSMIGTVGRVFRVESEPDYAIKNMGLFKIEDELKSKYLYFYFHSAQAKKYINECLAGSTQKFLSLGSLRKFPIIYPESRHALEQLVHILDSIDSKISLNNQINGYLAT